MTTWTTPRTWVPGELVTAAIGNVHWRDNFLALREGQIAIAGQVALDFIYAASATAFARLAAGTGRQRPRLNSAGLAWEFGNIGAEPIFEAAGSSTAAGATTVASFALPAWLTAKDALLLVFTHSSVTQQTVAPNLISVTDANAVVKPLCAGGSNLAAGTYCSEHYIIKPDQQSLTTWLIKGETVVPSALNNTDTGGNSQWRRASMTTGWTSTPTLGLQQGGVTAGGTYYYTMIVAALRGA